MISTSDDKEKDQACPICGKPVERGAKHIPFCSDRCRLVDLGKWFGGTYKMSRPLEERDLDEES